MSNNSSIVTQDDKLLQVFGNIKKSIAEIDDIQELISLNASASGYEEAWKKYFRTSGKGFEQMFYGWEAKIRSERRMGEMLKEMELDKGGRPDTDGNRLHDETSLDDLGISKIQSFRYQKLAKIDEKLIDKTIQYLWANFIEPATNMIVRLERDIKSKDESKTRFSVTPVEYGENIYFSSAELIEDRWDDHTITEDKYPTITRLSRFFHTDGREFSLREYARVQEFPDTFKFVGNYSSIKSQIGNAVSPTMAQYIGKQLDGVTFIDLFAGCGGLSCGLEMLNKRAIYAVEYERTYFQTYVANYPDVDNYLGDIVHVTKEMLPDADVVVGGPPCQGFSLAGLRLKDDPRNKLYKEFLRIVDLKRTNEFLLENVPEIAEIKEQIIDDFKNIGYITTFQIVHGPDIGMKQTRTRAFFIGKRL